MESRDSHHRLVVNPDTLTEVLEKAAQRAGVQLPLPASRSEEHPIRYYERLSSGNLDLFHLTAPLGSSARLVPEEASQRESLIKNQNS